MTILLGPSTITDPCRLLSAARQHTPHIIAACHLSEILDPYYRDGVVSHIVEELSRHDFDAIAICGLSGALVAPIVAERMGKTLIVVRKGETTHSSYPLEGDRAARRYVILDDLIATGKTCARIMETIESEIPHGTPECIGAFMYLRRAWWSPAELEEDTRYHRRLFEQPPAVAVDIETRDAKQLPYKWIYQYGPDGSVTKLP